MNDKLTREQAQETENLVRDMLKETQRAAKKTVLAKALYKLEFIPTRTIESSVAKRECIKVVSGMLDELEGEEEWIE